MMTLAIITILVLVAYGTVMTKRVEELSSEIDELKEHIYGTAADKVSMEQVDEASKRAGV